MVRTLHSRVLCRAVCLSALLLSVSTSLAATTLAPFSGQFTGEAPAPAEPLSLWYRQPATLWTSALPLGNGRQGAMVFGGIDSEVICLNESTLWSGSPYTPDNPDALAALPGPITRDGLLAQLRTMSPYDAGGFLGPIQLGAKLNNGCLIGMIVEGGAWRWVAPNEGFLC